MVLAGQHIGRIFNLNMWKTSQYVKQNMFTYKKTVTWFLLIFNRLKTLNRKDLLGGPPTWVESLCPAWRRCFWPERLLVGELYPPRWSLNMMGLNGLSNSRTPTYLSPGQGLEKPLVASTDGQPCGRWLRSPQAPEPGAVAWRCEQMRKTMGFPWDFPRFSLVSDHVNVKNHLPKLDFKQESWRYNRILWGRAEYPGLANCQTGTWHWCHGPCSHDLADSFCPVPIAVDIHHFGHARH